jgi:hypothetical protein
MAFDETHLFSHLSQNGVNKMVHKSWKQIQVMMIKRIILWCLIDVLFFKIYCRFCDGTNWFYDVNASCKFSLQVYFSYCINKSWKLIHLHILHVSSQALIYPCACYLKLHSGRLSNMQVFQSALLCNIHSMLLWVNKYPNQFVSWA